MNFGNKATKVEKYRYNNKGRIQEKEQQMKEEEEKTRSKAPKKGRPRKKDVPLERKNLPTTASELYAYHM